MIRIYESDNPSNSIEIPALEKPNLPAVVTFYRSEINANDNKYGNKDTGYNGEFGFDRFDQKVMAEGLASNYKKLDGVETKRDTTSNSNDYLCSYLSLYPPKVEGNLDNKKSIATLYVKLEEDIDRSDKNPKIGGIFFESSMPDKIKILGTETHKLSAKSGLAEKINKDEIKAKKIVLEIDDKAKHIKLECLKPFSEPIKITATTSNGDLIGQLIVVPNQKTYNLTVQPVYVDFSNKTDEKLGKKTLSEIPSIKLTELREHLNNKSLNQAFVNCEIAPNIHTFKFNRLLVDKSLTTKNILYNDEDKRGDFNLQIETKYSVLLQKEKNKNNVEVKKQEIYEQTRIGFAIKSFLNELNEEFKYNIKASNPCKEAYKATDKKRLHNAYSHKEVQKKLTEFRKKEEIMLQRFKSEGIKFDINEERKPNSINISKQGTVYVFYYPDIDCSYADSTNDLEKGKVPGYTGRGNGISHIFKSAFSLVDAVVHEIGHGLGLPHTFEKDLGKVKDSTIQTKEDYETKIEQLKIELEKLETDEKEYHKGIKEMSKMGITDLDYFFRYNTLNDEYTTTKSRASSLKGIYQQPLLKAYIYFIPFLKRIEEIVAIEESIDNIDYLGSGIKSTDIKKIEANILATKQQIETLELKKGDDSTPKNSDIEGEEKYHPQSKTNENYMDYDFDTSGKVNNDFKRKSLTYQQCQLIIKTGVEKGYLKP